MTKSRNKFEINNEKIPELNRLLEFNTHNNRKYIQSLFDYVQTHAVYGVYKEELEPLKAKLKAIGAIKFRVVKAHDSSFIILCFNADKIS